MLKEYDDGQATEWSCVYGSRASRRVQESGLHATRPGLGELQRVVKRSLCRLVWEVRWMKSKRAWNPMWNHRQLGVEQRRIQHTKAGRES